jgi:hypothetical protein
MNKERIIIDIEPRKLRFDSEPYVLAIKSYYVAAIDVFEIKTKKSYYLLISPYSLSSVLIDWQNKNQGSLIHLEFWINKKSSEKKSPYELTQA